MPLNRARRALATASAFAFVALADRARLRGRLEHAVGAAAQSDPGIDPGPGREGHVGDRHHHHRPDAGVRRNSGGFRRLIQIVFGLSIAFAASSFFLSFFQFGGGALV